MKWRLCKLVKTHSVEVSGGGELLTVWKLPRIIHRRLKTPPMIILKADMKYVTSSKILKSITDLGGVNLPFRGCLYFSYAATNIQTLNLLIWHQLYQETLLSSSEPPNWQISKALFIFVFVLRLLWPAAVDEPSSIPPWEDPPDRKISQPLYQALGQAPFHWH